jgi:hypothetical protein
VKKFLDPPYVFGRDPDLEKPKAGIGRGFASADDHVPVGLSDDAREVVDGHAACIRRDIEGWRTRRRYRRLEIGGINDLLSDADLLLDAQRRRDEAVWADVLAHGEVPDLARRQEALLHDPVVVPADLRVARPFIKALVRAIGVDRLAAER